MILFKLSEENSNLYSFLHKNISAFFKHCIRWTAIEKNLFQTLIEYFVAAALFSSAWIAVLMIEVDYNYSKTIILLCL